MGAEEVMNEKSRVFNQVDTEGTGQAIVVRNLTKVFPKSRRHAKPKVACNDVCLAVAPGECFGLLGPNGAGVWGVGGGGWGVLHVWGVVCVGCVGCVVYV